MHLVLHESMHRQVIANPEIERRNGKLYQGRCIEIINRNDRKLKEVPARSASATAEIGLATWRRWGNVRPSRFAVTGFRRRYGWDQPPRPAAKPWPKATPCATTSRGTRRQPDSNPVATSGWIRRPHDPRSTRTRQRRKHLVFPPRQRNTFSHNASRPCLAQGGQEGRSSMPRNLSRASGLPTRT